MKLVKNKEREKKYEQFKDNIFNNFLLYNMSFYYV